MSGDPRTAPLVLCQEQAQASKATSRLVEYLRRTAPRPAVPVPNVSGPAPVPVPNVSGPAPVPLPNVSGPAPAAVPNVPGPAPVPVPNVPGPAPAAIARTQTPLEDDPSPAGVQQVATAEAAAELAQRLVEGPRTYPVIVVTNASGHKPYLDAQRMADDLEGLVEVHLLVHGDPSWAFTGALPARLGVFGGAARVYPVETDWLSDETRAPLFFCWHGHGADKITTRVIEAGLSAAHSAGLLQAAPAAVHEVQTQATVIGPMGDFHVLLRLPDGGQAVALAAALRPGVPAERLVSKGQRLLGFASRAGGSLSQFRLVPVVDDPGRRVREAYPDGATVLARAVEVGELSAKVALHPDVEVWLTADPAGPPLTRLIDAGDVIAVEVQSTGDQITCRLAEDEELLPAIPVVPGGPPWLLPEDLVEQEEEQSEVESAPPPAVEPEPPAAPTPASLDQLRATRQERVLLDARLSAAEAELAAAKSEAAKLRRSLREANQKLKQASKRAQEFADRTYGRAVYSDPERQLRHEIWLQYLARIPEAQRAEMPLAEYRFGPGFAQSLDRLEGISRDKVVDVLVEVLTGIVTSLSGRQLHAWRTSVTGPQQTRADGAAAWRCSLQVNTPSARRLKYWQLPSGGIEFDSVGVHDEGI